MLQGKDKISLRQGMLIFLTIIYVPNTRITPAVSAEALKQAGWITPILPFFVMMFHIWIISRLFKNCDNQSFFDILTDIFGSVPAKLVSSLYLIFVVVQTAQSTRLFGERIVSTIFPNANISIFVALFIILVMYSVKSGLVVLARMTEIIFLVVAVLFFITIGIILPGIKTQNILPVTSRDIVPAMKVGLKNISPLYSFIMFIYLVGDKVNDKEKTLKYGFYCAVSLLVGTVALTAAAIGVLGPSLTAKAPFPYFSAVVNSPALGVQRFQPIIITLWMYADFVSISILTLVSLAILKFLFNLKNEMPIRIPYLALIFVFSLIFGNSRFEITKYTSTISIVWEACFLFIIPVVVLTVGMMRKKV